MCRIRQQRLKEFKLESPSVDSYGERGFTVTELMVAVSLMSLIVFALYAMFNQTQKAMRANEAQVDSTERGRSVLELVSREIESARAGAEPNVTNLWLNIAPSGKRVQGDVPTSLTVAPRTNVFDNLFYITKANKAWRGVAYTVLGKTNNGAQEIVQPLGGGMGTLFRYETPAAAYEYGHPGTNLFKSFLTLNPNLLTAAAPTAPATNYSQIADGVVHFKLLPYDSQGRIMSFNSTNLDANYRIFRALADGSMVGANTLGVTNSRQATVTLRQTFLGNNSETTAAFRSNALPAYLELELGVLEPDTMRVYRQMVSDGQQTQADQFLAKRISKVQIFRKRIPLRSVAQ